MKTFLRFTFTLLFIFSFQSSQAQIPNAGFESWVPSPCTTWGPDSFPLPWTTRCNLPLAFFTGMSKSADAHSGDWALQLAPSELGDVIAQWIPSYIQVSVPLTQMPINFSGYYKYSNSDSLDKAAFIMFFTRYNFPMGTTDTLYTFVHTLDTVSAWTPFNFGYPILPVLDPDTVHIIALSDSFDFTNPWPNIYDASGVLLLDDLQFDGSTSNGFWNHADYLHIYPNPAANECLLKPSLLLSGTEIEVRILTADGRHIQRLRLNGEPYALNTSDWAPGIYFLTQFIAGKYRGVRKLIINR